LEKYGRIEIANIIQLYGGRTLNRLVKQLELRINW